MSGTSTGGQKAARKNLENNPNFYKEIGRKGGLVSHPETRPFAANRELARKAGARGGKVSKRSVSLDTEVLHYEDIERIGVHIVGKHSTTDNKRSKENLYND